MASEIRDIGLKAEGYQRIAWVKPHMPVLSSLYERFSKERPLEGVRIALSVHLEAKTAFLIETLVAGGAQMSVTGCNPLSTQDPICAALADQGIDVHGVHNVSEADYERMLIDTLRFHPHIIVDDGGDLVNLLISSCQEMADQVIGGCEETTTGIHRLQGWEKQGRLPFAMMAVNDARSKHLFDNRYGTGQSVWTAIMNNTNLQVNGKQVVIAGYGHCGRGVAHLAKGMGARVIVTEVDPVPATEAMMDGFQVMPMDQAAPLGDLFITLTGCKDVIRPEHFSTMKDGAILCNAGHFNVEICMKELQEMAVEVSELRKNILGYRLSNGRQIAVIAEGRLVNLAAGDGHPAEIMDMSFALQAACIEYLAKLEKPLPKGLHKVPTALDDQVAALKLASLGGGLDRLTPEQVQYLAGLEDMG